MVKTNMRYGIETIFWLLCFSHSRYVFDMRGALEVRWLYACALWFEACFVFLSGNIVFVFRKISNTHLTTCCILHSHVNLTGSGRSCQEIQRSFSLLAKTTKTSQNQAHSVHLTASKGWLMHFCGDRKGCFALFSPPGTGNRSHATVIMMMY